MRGANPSNLGNYKKWERLPLQLEKFSLMGGANLPNFGNSYKWEIRG